MRRSGSAAPPFLLLLFTGVLSAQPTETLLGTVGEPLSLPCHSFVDNGTGSTAWVQWFLDEQGVVSRNLSERRSLTGDARLSVSDGGALNISDVREKDGGSYLCRSSPGAGATDTSESTIRLVVVSGPVNVVTVIEPTKAVSKDTLSVAKGSSVSFRCSSESWPSQSISWVFGDNDTLASGNESSLEFELYNIQPNKQGNYSCRVQNVISKQIVVQSTELLVYFAPDTHPECYSMTGNDSSRLLLLCGWSGGNPVPVLHWTEEQGGPGSREPVLNISATADLLAASLNRSSLYDGQTFKCTGYHQESAQNRSCSVTVRSPYPEGQPMVSVVEGSNVTLTCTDSRSLPPARTTWKRTIRQEDIVPSSKYVMIQEGPTFMLTIENVTKEDEGIYFCHSENPLNIIELEIYLTVRSSAGSSGAAIGVFISVLILAVAIVIGTSAYQNRHRICLGNSFSNTGEERNDEITLVESDEDELFSDSVTRITTTANGHSTSLVQVHTFPSSDHEDLADPLTEEEEMPSSPEQNVDSL